MSDAKIHFEILRNLMKVSGWSGLGGKQNPMTFPGFPGPRFICSDDFCPGIESEEYNILYTSTRFAVIDNLFPKIEERIWIEITS